MVCTLYVKFKDGYREATDEDIEDTLLARLRWDKVGVRHRLSVEWRRLSHSPYVKVVDWTRKGVSLFHVLIRKLHGKKTVIIPREYRYVQNSFMLDERINAMIEGYDDAVGVVEK